MNLGNSFLYSRFQLYFTVFIMGCPTIDCLKSYIDSMSPEQNQAFLNCSDEERFAMLREAGVDFSSFDKVELIKYLKDAFSKISDDDLAAASGGEKVAVKAAAITATGVVTAAAVTATATLSGTLGAAAINANAKK